MAKTIQVDFGGIIKWSIIGGNIYVDHGFVLELKRRILTCSLYNNVCDIIGNDEELLAFFRNNQDLINCNLFAILTEAPINSTRRILELAMFVEMEEAREDAKANHGGKNGKGSNLY